jgi:signal transduction histidine kinase
MTVSGSKLRRVLIGGGPTIGAVPATPHIFPGTVSTGRRSGWAGLAVFAGFLAIGVFSRAGDDLVGAAGGAALGLAGAVPLFLARSRLALAGVALAGAGVVVAGNADSRDVGWFALLVIVAWAILAFGIRPGVACWAAGVAVFASEWAWAVKDPGWAPWTAGLSVTAVAMVMVRHQLVLVEALRAAQAGLAERSAAEERNRIAREIHDVLAHCLTVSLLHISAARLAVETDPADAARALVEAERLARQSLEEVRATMGLLDAGAGPPGVAPPVPGAGQLPDLVDQLRRAGATVHLAVEGNPDDLPATTGSALFRIAQEALTNAAKHAPGSAVEMRLDITGDRVEFGVETCGPAGHGSGMGLQGMRERARAVGGSCSAGPYRNGWRVHACLPVSDAPGEVQT